MTMSHSSQTLTDASAIAFDYGSRHIGVAAGNRVVGSAQGVGVVSVKDGKPDDKKIDAIIKEWQPNCLVVGLPLVEGKMNLFARSRVKRFGNSLSENYGLPVYYVDERLSTEEATHRIRAAGKQRSVRKLTELRNMIAAEIILETYFSK